MAGLVPLYQIARESTTKMLEKNIGWSV